MKLNLIILSVLLFSSKISIAQVQDSFAFYIEEFHSIKNDTQKVDFMHDLVWEIRRSQPETSKRLLSYLEEYGNENEFKYKESIKYYYLSLIYKSESDFKQSEYFLQKYYDYHAARKDTAYMGFANQALCNMYFDFNQYEKSMEAAKRSLVLKGDQLDPESEVIIKGRIGAILCEMDQFEKAIEIQHEILKIATKDSLTNLLPNILNDLGLIYERMEEVDSMFYYYNEFKDVSIEYDNKHQLVYAHYNIASALQDTGNYKLALENYRTSIKLAQETNDEIMQNASRVSYAHMLSKLNNNREALKVLDQINTEGKEQTLLKNYYGTLAEVNESLGNYKLALKNQKLFKAVSDTILNQDVTQQISDLRIGYESEVKEGKIQLLNKENEFIENALKKSNRDKILAILGMLIMMVFFYLLYRNNQIIKKNRQELKQKNEIISKSLTEKDFLLKEIHHRVKNNLQVISSLLSIQSRGISDPEAKLAITEGRNRVKSMALIHQNLYQDDNLVGVSVKAYVEKLCAGLVKSYNVNLEEISISNHVQDIEIDVDQIIPIGLILNELISNALKYAFDGKSEGKIEVALTETDKEINFSVRDNGNGFPSDFNPNTHGNMGFQIIRAFVSKLNAVMEFNSKTKGTNFNFSIPKHV